MPTPEVRSYRRGDEAAINDGFNRVFGQQRSLEEWAWKYRADNPPLPIVAAWDRGRVAAHNGGIRAELQIDGRRFNAVQGVDTYSLAAMERRPEWRSAWSAVMDRFAEVAAREFGASILYGFTGGRAVSHMVVRARWDSVEPRRIPLFVRLERPTNRSIASRFFSARPVVEDEPALDLLWNRVSHRYPVAVIRDAAFIRHRLGRHPSVHYHRWLIFRRFSSTPVAFAAFRSDDGCCRWVDLVWDDRHPGALELIDHLSRRLAVQTGARREELWLDGDADAAAWLRTFGFSDSPDPSSVARVTRILDDEVSPGAFAEGRFYTTMVDADLV
jgi:hypothetical protein